MTTWILVFFAILGGGLAGILSAQIRLVKFFENRALSRWAARAAVRAAQIELLGDDTAADTLAELRPERELVLGFGRVAYSFVDEESKIGLNTATAEILSRLPGLGAEGAEKIVDSTLRPFHVEEELLLVEGVSAEAFEACRPFVTVHTDGQVNINTAPVEVLEALGLEEPVARAIAGFRAGPDGKEGTEDDAAFDSAGGIMAQLRGSFGFSQEQEQELLQLITQGLLTVASTTHTLEVKSTVLGRPAVSYFIVFTGEQIKRWREL